MATVKRRAQFRKAEPHATRDLKWYMSWKIDSYINYLDELDPDSIYKLEYDTDVPTKEELLNSIDQNHPRLYNVNTRTIEPDEEEDLADKHIDELIEYTPEQLELQKQLLSIKADKEIQAQKRRTATWGERKEVIAEIKQQKEQKDKYRKVDRQYIWKYYKDFGMQGLNILYQDAIDNIANLDFIIIRADVVTDHDIELRDAYIYRVEYVKKLIQQERQKRLSQGE